MKNTLLAGAVLALSLSLTAVHAQEQCIDANQNYLQMNYQTFDQSVDGGWRAVADKEGCQLAAADLIHQYTNAKSDLSEGDTKTLNWHEGQLRAIAGQSQRAIALFEQTYKPTERDIAGWNYYVDATIAFIQQDKAKLLQSRETLADVKMPEGLNMTNADGKPVEIEWPMNLDIVDRFIACFGASYKEAYSGKCEGD